MPQLPSKQWLAAQTADWKVKTHLNINVPREEALEIISREGMLLVLCSFIDNMPYVVAEAAVRLNGRPISTSPNHFLHSKFAAEHRSIRLGAELDSHTHDPVRSAAASPKVSNVLILPVWSLMQH